MATKLGVGVAGVGTLGARHATNLRRLIPEARLVGVADTDYKRASRVAAELELELYYDSIEALVERKDIQAVVIASPSKFHAGSIRLAASAGKHVFCEKPPALTLEDMDASLKAVAKAEIQLQIGFMRRYDPAYADAKKRIEAGEIGDPIVFKSVGRDAERPPLTFFEDDVNGTIFSDSSIHDFDLARWMMNDEVVEVHAYAGLLACPELAQFNEIDSAVVNLRLARGGIGNVDTLRKSTYGYDIRTEILGTKGALQVGYLRQTPEFVLTRTGITCDVVDHWLVRFAEAYVNELRDFVRTILAGGSTRVSGEDGRRALEVAVAAEESYRRSRVVKLGLASHTRKA